VTSSSEPKLVWYAPDCKVLEERDGPSRFEVYTYPEGRATKLKIHDISLTDRGLYRLQARSEEDEEWAYFSLNVKSEDSSHFNILVIYLSTTVKIQN
jgi:hypothetical protein